MAVVKISARGKNSVGLIYYLFGPGRHNEHTDPHTLAGSVHYPAVPVDDSLRLQIGRDLRAYAEANPQVKFPGDKHIWHASITLAPEEPMLGDQTWSKIAADYMRDMGFEDPAKGAVQWTAVHHGANVSGSDHIHLVMSLVRADGTRVNIHNDAKRSAQVINGLERKYNLAILQGRGLGASPVPFTHPENAKARANKSEIERRELEGRVREAAALATGEADFVRRLRHSGAVVKPRVIDGKVTGYSAAMSGSSIAFAGGALGRDLTLPRLRQRWTDTSTARQLAKPVWVGKSAVTAPRTQPMVTYQQAMSELGEFTEKVATSTDPQVLRETGADLGGALSVAANHDPQLSRLARQVSSVNQTRGYVPRTAPPGLSMTSALLIQTLAKGSPMAQALMIKQVLSALRAVSDLHRAQCQVALRRENQTMTAPSDGLDEATEHAATLAVTMAATALQNAAQRKQAQLAEQQREQRRMERLPDSEPGQIRDPDAPITGPQRWRMAHDLERKGIEQDPAEVAALTKGEASELIDALKEVPDRKNASHLGSIETDLTPDAKQARPNQGRAYEGPDRKGPGFKS